MKNELLIAYASRHGATAAVARAIAQELSANGYAATLKSASEVEDVSEYAGIILGSAIRFGNWLPEMVRLVKRHKQAMQGKPCVIFSCHILNLGSSDAERLQREKYTKLIRSMIAPKDDVFFAGDGNIALLSRTEKILAKMVRAPEHDCRDWAKIHVWAQHIGPILDLPATVVDAELTKALGS